MKSDAIYLQHILDAIHKIESYVKVGRDAPNPLITCGWPTRK